jgi:hypothetical protein
MGEGRTTRGIELMSHDRAVLGNTKNQFAIRKTRLFNFAVAQHPLLAQKAREKWGTPIFIGCGFYGS